MRPLLSLSVSPSCSSKARRRYSASIALDGAIDAAHKHERGGEADGAQHDESGIRGDQHVSEEEGGLEEAKHAAAAKVVEEAVGVDEEARRAAREEGSPPPAVVLDGELEVGEGDGDEGGDDDEHEKGDEQDAVERVELVAPDGREDVVQLDVDGREGEEARHEDLARALPVPDGGRDLARDLVSAARRVEVAALGRVPSEDASDDGQRQRDERPDDQDDQDRPEGERGLRPVPDGHRVEKDKHQEQRHREERRREDESQRPPPLRPDQPAVEVRRHEARRARGEGVQHDRGGVHGSSVARVEEVHHREQEQEDDERKELRARADKRAEAGKRGRQPEDISVHELPPRLLLLLPLEVRLLHVARHVVLEDAHQDNGEEAGEEEDEDEGVDDREPVDLEGLRQEGVLRVPPHPLGVGDVRLDPADRVGEVDLVAVLGGEVETLQRIRRHVDLDDCLAVVGDREVEVREEKVAGRVVDGPREVDALGLELADVAPDGQLVEHELEVVVVEDCGLEAGGVVSAERGFAEGPRGDVLEEADLVERLRRAVALHQRTKVLSAVFQLLRRAVRQLVVVVHLVRVCKRADLVCIEHDLRALLVAGLGSRRR
mmetsp:Transcript_4020/g.12845  ORF Transcript_4020/g.12845 Transcript_4020/m.12845 type:complete len:604 (+) Transcript_4020:257-2068(+)